MPSDPTRTSVWHATAEPTSYPSLPGDRDADVIVVGAGITGLTTALLLVEAGVEVTVLEARHVAAGATGGTTGKVTSQHGVIYGDLVERHGEDAARAYGEMNEQAVREVAAVRERWDIEAGWEAADAYVYANTEDEADELREEASVARRLGLPAVWSDEVDLPFAVRGALRFNGQAQMHPVAYANGLARAVDGQPNGTVHEATRVTSLGEVGDRVHVTTTRGRVTADEVVLATLLPITDRGFEFARARASRSYGIAATVDGDVPRGMYLSAGGPSRSVRRYDARDGTYLVVVGDAHDVGHDRDTRRHDAALEEFARRHFDVREVAFRWSAQDYLPDDRLPFVGTTNFSTRIHVATGFQKWGLTNGTAAARVLADLITGRPNPYAALLRPTRATVVASARQFVEHNLDVARRFVVDRALPDADTVDDIAPGTGGTVRVDGRLLAVTRHEDGRVTTRSAICTHLGCVVQWNQGERSWDCPCHGSRFSAEGEILEGPATSPLHEA